MVNGEIWLPSYGRNPYFSGRLLFFKGNVNQIDRYSDYKKFHADSKIVTWRIERVMAAWSEF